MPNQSQQQDSRGGETTVKQIRNRERRGAVTGAKHTCRQTPVKKDLQGIFNVVQVNPVRHRFS
ncbi:hypothetical protein YC2023_057712 [Brassica napus]